MASKPSGKYSGFTSHTNKNEGKAEWEVKNQIEIKNGEFIQKAREDIDSFC